MKLATKLVAALLLEIVALIAIYGMFTVHGDEQIFASDIRRNGHLLGSAMAGLLADVWRANGEARALALIDEANAEEQLVTLRWTWVDAPPGDRFAPGAPRNVLGPLAEGREVTFRSDGPLGAFYTYVPVAIDGERKGALELSESLTHIDQRTGQTSLRVVGLAAVIVLGGAVIAAVLGVRMVGRPLALLSAKARRAGAGDLSGPLDLRRRDELGDLAGTMNEMCAQLEEARDRARQEAASRIAALEQLRHTDRLMTVGRLASGIAHELGTPLNVIAGRADLIARGLPPPAIVDSARIIRDQAERVTRTVRQLLQFARRKSAPKAIVDLRAVAREAVDLLGSIGHRTPGELRLEVEDVPAKVAAEAGQIQQVVTNLLVNAMQATRDDSEIVVGIRREQVEPPADASLPAGEFLCLYVQDHGQGITPKDREHLFEPFFTTKDVGEGTGLGLSIAFGIVRDHGGWIAVDSEVGRGSRFSVYLPEAERT